MDLPLRAQVRHSHYLCHQTSPASKVLRSLASASFRVILLPRESCILPLTEHILNEILSKFRVHVPGLVLVWTRDSRGVLFKERD